MLREPEDPARWQNCNSPATAYSLRSGTYEHSGEGEKERESDIAKALTHLRIAVEKGYADWEHLKKDSDLDALRAKDEYMKLVAGR